MRTLISSGSLYEPKVSISRAVRVGSIVAVSGTALLGPNGGTVGKGDPGAQARRCLEIIVCGLPVMDEAMIHQWFNAFQVPTREELAVDDVQIP